MILNKPCLSIHSMGEVISKASEPLSTEKNLGTRITLGVGKTSKGSLDVGKSLPESTNIYRAHINQYQ